MENYFNTLSLREQLAQLGKCRLMEASEFEKGIQPLEGKKIVILGCGNQLDTFKRKPRAEQR